MVRCQLAGSCHGPQGRLTPPSQDADFDQSLSPGLIHAPALPAMAKPLLLVDCPVNMGDWPALSGLRVRNLFAYRIQTDDAFARKRPCSNLPQLRGDWIQPIKLYLQR